MVAVLFSILKHGFIKNFKAHIDVHNKLL
jgi:hypothetical protein